MLTNSIKVGVTGSIGMGKSTVASEIKKKNIPVWSADETVHTLYKQGNGGYNLILDILPEVAKGKIINRGLLTEIFQRKPYLLKIIEKLIHPLVEIERINFIKRHKKERLIVFDIPLLFEKSADQWLDHVIVVTAPFFVQRDRVLKRESMNQEKFSYILSQQLSNEQKLNKADYIIDTNVKYSIMVDNIKIVLDKINNEHS